MKISKLLIVPAFLLGMGMMYSQTNQNQTTSEKTIRVKMVKNMNGVETTFDTTIVGGDLTDVHDLEGIPQIEIQIDSTHSMDGDQHVIVKTIDINGSSNDSNVVIRVIDGNDHEMDKIMKEHGIDIKDGKEEKRVIVINDDQLQKDDGKKGDHKLEVRVIIKSCNIEDLNKDDKKQLKANGRLSNDNLKIEELNYYPNPNNGHFNLGFTLPKQGDTQIMIFNMEGKNVYEENLPNFSGTYKNEIDISKNPSGVYFIKVTQNGHSMFKKMILE